MPGKHNAGGCGCCESDSPCCLDYTAITISGLANAGCTSGCDDRNGTWTYRSLGDPFVPSFGLCGKSIPGFSYNDNCGAGFPFVGNAGCGTGNNTASVEFDFTIPGEVTVRISISLVYNVPAGGGDVNVATYTGVWSDTKPTCAALVPTLDTTVITVLPPPAGIPPCPILGGDPGDFCNLFGATVGLA